MSLIIWGIIILIIGAVLVNKGKKQDEKIFKIIGIPIIIIGVIFLLVWPATFTALYLYSPSNVFSDTTIETVDSTYKKVSITAKAKVENRYVIGTTNLPDVSSGPTGIVVVNIKTNRLGTVISVSINESSTISDEDILDACKEAALKTDFSYNPNASTTGIITYTFTTK